MPHRAERVEEIAYIEFVRRAFMALVPALIMSGAYVLSTALLYWRFRDPWIGVIGLFGVAASASRLFVVIVNRPRALGERLDANGARRLERTFAVSYLGFAICLGILGWCVLRSPEPEAHMLIICLLVGYCAGVAATVGLRPRIALPAMLIAIVPALAAAALRLEPIYVGLAIVASMLLAGGARSVLEGHRMMLAEVGKRIAYGSLARHDSLTKLPNRLALSEWFDRESTILQSDQLIAAHYIDLDDFKPVNDTYGHLAGDALLVAIAERLSKALRQGEILARLGGDEFVVLQRGLEQAESAELTARRLTAALRQPFRLQGMELAVTACIGTALGRAHSLDLEQLLESADTALYKAKRRGIGKVEHSAVG